MHHVVVMIHPSKEMVCFIYVMFVFLPDTFSGTVGPVISNYSEEFLLGPDGIALRGALEAGGP